MDFGGLISGALRGGADALGTVAKTEYESGKKLDLAKQMSDMEEQKQLRIDEITRGRNIADVGRLAQANADAAPIKAKGDVAARLATANAVKDSGLPAIEAGIEEQAYDAKGGLRGKQRADKALDTTSEVTARGNAETGVITARNSDPVYIKGVKAFTAASHFFGPQDQLATEQLKKLQQVSGLQSQLAATTDPDAREQLIQKLGDLQGSTKSQNELRTAYVQTEKAKAAALKTLSDPMATEEAKSQAEESLTALEQLGAQLKKQLNIKPKADAPAAQGPWSKYGKK